MVSHELQSDSQSAINIFQRLKGGEMSPAVGNRNTKLCLLEMKGLKVKGQ